MLKNQCPVCNYHKLFSIRHLKGERTGKLFRLWFCRNCHSLFNPSGYREDDEQLRQDVDWHSDNYDNHVKWAEVLIYNLLSEHREARSLIDIGCGIGSIVTTAKSFNLKKQLVLSQIVLLLIMPKKNLELNLSVNTSKMEYASKSLTSLPALVCLNIWKNLEFCLRMLSAP